MATSGYDPTKDITCPICLEPFKTPKMLPCGHTFCLEPCLRRLAGTSGRVNCPECRASFIPPHGNVDSFPTNFIIVRLIDNTKEFQKPTAKVPEKRKCPTCDKPTYLFGCLHCNTDICETCRTNHTDIMRAKTIEDLDKLETKTEEKLKLYIGPDVKKDLDSKCIFMTHKIDIAVDNMIAKLEMRRTQLKHNVQMFDESERLRIDEREKLFKVKVVETAEFIKETEVQLATGGNLTQTAMFQIQCQVGKHKKFNGLLQSDAKQPTTVSMSINEVMLGHNIASFGELLTKDRRQLEDMEVDDNFVPDGYFPRQSPTPKTFDDEADVLLHGLKRNKKKGNRR